MKSDKLKKLQRIPILLLAALMIISLAGCSLKDLDDNASELLSNAAGNKSDGNDVSDILSQNSGNSDLIIDQPITEDNTNSEENLFIDNNHKENSETNISINDILSSICEFRVIDCGQADSILIHNKENTILIDAGEEKKASAIRNVLDNLGISKIDLLIGTHPHSDHIGGMQTIVENYDISQIIMSPTGHTSKTYEELLKAIDAKGLSITAAEEGNEYDIGDIHIELLGPCDSYKDLNDNSVVAIASYGSIDMLLTGDAEFTAEKDYVDNIAYDATIELLKVGHHGSDTSTSDYLLNTISPDVAVISCGTGNKYGHPTEETLTKLDNRNIQVYRTDLSGDIMIRTDGNNYTIETSKDIPINKTNGNNINETAIGSNNENNVNESTNSNILNSNSNEETNDTSVDTGLNNIVYVSKTGSKYHLTPDCPRLYVSTEKFEITEYEAIQGGKEKCSRCWGD